MLQERVEGRKKERKGTRRDAGEGEGAVAEKRIQICRVLLRPGMGRMGTGRCKMRWNGTKRDYGWDGMNSMDQCW